MSNHTVKTKDAAAQKHGAASAPRNSREDLVEVVCLDMMCFEVDAETLEVVTCSYYEPAAWNDPRGPQMRYGEWLVARAKQWDSKFVAVSERRSTASDGSEKAR